MNLQKVCGDKVSAMAFVGLAWEIYHGACGSYRIVDILDALIAYASTGKTPQDLIDSGSLQTSYIAMRQVYL